MQVEMGRSLWDSRFTARFCEAALGERLKGVTGRDSESPTFLAVCNLVYLGWLLC
jgi:hypothetical protein